MMTSIRNIQKSKHFPGPYFYDVYVDIGNGMIEHSIIKTWNIGYDEEGNKIGNYNSLTNGIHPQYRVNLTELFKFCDLKLITDDVLKAKLLLMGL